MLKSSAANCLHYPVTPLWLPGPEPSNLITSASVTFTFTLHLQCHFNQTHWKNTTLALPSSLLCIVSYSWTWHRAKCTDLTCQKRGWLSEPNFKCCVVLCVCAFCTHNTRRSAFGLRDMGHISVCKASHLYFSNSCILKHFIAFLKKICGVAIMCSSFLKTSKPAVIVYPELRNRTQKHLKTTKTAAVE